ncbi:unnamed protein product, partial [Mesorhabditis belari]|uniref:Uncharacterized protein n=1 Tax=Mesorhabditis belari TaxID=2138241 RepID=A0AAF3EZ19_9BILA
METKVKDDDEKVDSMKEIEGGEEKEEEDEDVNNEGKDGGEEGEEIEEEGDGDGRTPSSMDENTGGDSNDSNEIPLPDSMVAECEISETPITDQSPDSRAAIVFDPSNRTFKAINIRALPENSTTGEEIDINGTIYTINEFFETFDEAQKACEQKVETLNSTSSGQLFFNATRNGGSYEESYEDDEVEATEINAELFNAGEPSPVPQQEKGPENDPIEAIRYLFAVYYNELSEDITRLNRRQESLCTMMETVLGGSWTTGSVDERRGIDPREPRVLRRLGAKNFFRLQPAMRPSTNPMTDEYRDLLLPEPETSSQSNARRSCTLPENREKFRRQRYDDDGENSEESANYKGTAKGGHPGYPYISKEDEELCLTQSCGVPANYAQRVARILFKDSLQLYFKEQDPRKRHWIHDMVDFRFPSEDKQTQMYKWKNCSWAINKNRHGKEPQAFHPRRSTYLPDTSNASPSNANFAQLSYDKRKGQHYKSWTGKEEISHVKPDFPYVSEEIEQGAYEKSPHDPIKYTEILAFQLFHDSLDKLFSEQDGAKKEWLRDMVDYRFPLDDKLKRDTRWKVCGAAANRNRLKHVVNGVVLAYPYTSKEFEENCLRAARGNPTVYAEMMGRGLFAESINVSFKDQDPRKRTWLHDILDRRFPTHDKIKQIQKWKLCSSAINKNRSLTNAQLDEYRIAAAKSSTAHSGASTSKKEEKETITKPKEEKEPHTRARDPPRNREEIAPTATTRTQARSTSRGATTSTLPVTEEPPLVIVKHPRSRGVEKETPKETNGIPGTRSNDSIKLRAVTKRSAAPATTDTPIVTKMARRKNSLLVADPTIAFPYNVNDDQEEEFFQKSDGSASSYAKTVAQILFKDNLNAYFKEQDEDRRNWLRKLVDARFPTPRKRDQEIKWKNCQLAINKNRSS